MKTDPFQNIINDVYRLVGNTSPNNLDLKLLDIAKQSPRKQSRVCLHKEDSSAVQIMYICHLKNCKVKIHKHIDFPEWIIFINSKSELIYFDNEGNKKENIIIDTFSNKGPIFHLIPKNIWHTLEFKKDSFFLEVKQGPFNKNNTIYL